MSAVETGVSLETALLRDLLRDENAELKTWQEDALRLAEGKNLLLITPRAKGRSAVSTIYAVKKALQFPKTQVLMVRPKGHWVDTLKLLRDGTSIADEIQSVTAQLPSVLFKNGSTIVAATSEASIRGRSPKTLVVDDIDRLDLAVIDAVRGLVANRQANTLLMGSEEAPWMVNGPMTRRNGWMFLRINGVASE